MTNNDILKKLRVAHQLRDTDIVDILALVDFRVTKSELNALFRREDHPNYVECGDQILRNFLNGLVIHLRGPMPKKGEKPSGDDSAKAKPKKIDLNKTYNKSQKKSN
ncbi:MULTISPECIES: DUF1456 family protein [Flavobacteriaceae]|uniref:DUF1456 family protein n=1 Tax=Flavobacteriaceae TaxID=49546 RepID=UPI000C304FCD|nr:MULTISPECIES: DUF1456 family protein [Flavobacteriaceae]AUC75592.1 DUF1456 domain-containing protein [Olleya sp. Bg11-27]QCE43462.1 DUF1456 family protein [Psychroserpens sp. NJDZ02]QXP61907.1 DUF1456 family protein [Olleya sp. HaHaR_3_96]